ncbi:Peptidase C1A papain C-terminal domain-containing protein [Plasmodiophora brassicae]|uniref:Peptidase C1A papain C-terminal domain-containing protein n=1 Tax=Plasmodiophora brassicae TaxID=37360 RepID=A0A0G4IJ86_PLABS|nr:hypothetical protein PBRA_003906 [Plasmodiophora brassicae]SPQ96411.1 unnamed protein product [Plasmodiophora brassicae]
MFIGVHVAVLIAATRFIVGHGYRATPWGEYKARQGKEYSAGSQELYRYRLWSKRVSYVNQHNAKNSTWKLAVNRFADLTDKEIRSYMGITLPSTRDKNWDALQAHTRTAQVEADAIRKTSFLDWTTVPGVVSPVKDQGPCATCWAFATAGALEGAWALSRNLSSATDLSAEMLADCTYQRASPNETCTAGGWLGAAFQYAQRNALCNDAAYPYAQPTSSPSRCRSDSCQPHVNRIASFSIVSLETESALMSALRHQPIAVVMCANYPEILFYKSGVIIGSPGWNDPDCVIDHSVLLVGYGYDAKARLPYWKLKNQWGPSFGEQGYFRIARGASNPDGPFRILYAPFYASFAPAAPRPAPASP